MSLLLLAIVSPSLSSQIKPKVYLDASNRLDILLDDGTEIQLYGAITEYGKKKVDKYYYLPVYLTIKPVLINADRVPDPVSVLTAPQMNFTLSWNLIEEHELELKEKIKKLNKNAFLLGPSPISSIPNPLSIKGNNSFVKALRESLSVGELDENQQYISFTFNKENALVLQETLMNPYEIDNIEIQFRGLYQTLLYSPKRPSQTHEVLNLTTFLREGLAGVRDISEWIQPRAIGIAKFEKRRF